MDKEKPNWMQLHEEADNKRFSDIDGSLKEIKDMLVPVVEVYETVARLGKWGKVSLGFLLLVLSVAIAFRSLFTK